MPICHFLSRRRGRLVCVGQGKMLQMWPGSTVFLTPGAGAPVCALLCESFSPSPSRKKNDLLRNSTMMDSFTTRSPRGWSEPVLLPRWLPCRNGGTAGQSFAYRAGVMPCVQKAFVTVYNNAWFVSFFIAGATCCLLCRPSGRAPASETKLERHLFYL
jgi:hypothetical protein